MSKADRERWEARYQAYADGSRTAELTPDQLLTDHAALFSGEGEALDLACGLGTNALWLAEQGYATTALDTSAVALELCTAEARRRGLQVIPVQSDVESWAWPVARFDVICVFRFLDRGSFDAIRTALAPGGLLVYQTFNTNHLSSRPGFNPDYVLATNELNDAFPDLEIVVNDQTGTSTRFIARN